MFFLPPSFLVCKDLCKMDADLNKRLDRIERLTLLAAKNVLTVEDLALLIGRSPKTIRNQVDQFPHYKNGRNVYFRKDEIESFLCQVKCTPIEQIISRI